MGVETKGEGCRLRSRHKVHLLPGLPTLHLLIETNPEEALMLEKK